MNRGGAARQIEAKKAYKRRKVIMKKMKRRDPVAHKKMKEKIKQWKEWEKGWSGIF
jgi:hypothetical protein